jgi:cell shape-determining protein MreC
MDDRQELPGLLPELRELRQQQIENETLIEELRKQNQQLKSILAEYNTALKKCIQMLEKPMQNGY